MKNNKNIILILIIFLSLQPIFDISYFYNIEVLGFTIPTIIRLSIVGILTIYFLLTKKNTKSFYIYLILMIVYMILHLVNIGNFNITLNKETSYLNEIFYIIRLTIPMLFIYILYDYEIPEKVVKQVFLYTSIIVSTMMIFSNIFMIATPTYEFDKSIAGNIFSWFTLDKSKVFYSEVATKGFFLYPNALATLLCIILGMNAYFNYKKLSWYNTASVLVCGISMLILGTRVSSYGIFIILGLTLIIYLFCSLLIKNMKFNSKTLIINLIILTSLSFVFINSPINFKTHREMPEETLEYVEEENLYDVVTEVVNQYVKNPTLEKRNNLITVMLKNCEFFYINKFYIENVYPIEKDLDFWIQYYSISYNEKHGNREFESYLFGYLYNKNNNFLDKWFGFGYSKTFYTGILIEKDYLYHFYTIGLIGMLLLLGGYFITIISSSIYILKDIKKHATFKRLTILMIIMLIIVMAYFSGNVIETFSVNIFLSFICSLLLCDIIKEKKVGVNNEK